MTIKNKNKNNGADIAGTVIEILQNSAITIFWETVDKVKKQIKVKVEIGFQYFLGVLAILVGLIFTLVGIANFLEEIVQVRGVGYILVGVLVTVGGIWVNEKVKVRNSQSRKVTK